ncbi:Oxidoreductase molybdopterin binding domain protein [Roseovarius litorisediminis]|uniref:Oxidoreductase molybdopterin binding domain protein n=1 Tax=Roseovarius litorisediminis TaxID=1312363 RepID=A0A1Y5R762_9RHOB|nr:Oxidoreductase molybdopterin binding domain protein [Roseovarius litorisediminis]
MVIFWKSFLFLIVLAISPVAHAKDTTLIKAPDAAVLLTIDMQEKDCSISEQIRLTLEDLKELPVDEINTTTIWTEGTQTFRGVRLSTLLTMLDREAVDLELIAINGYRVTIPAADITPEGPLLAYQRNGKAMSARQNGPLWMVYDYDSNPAFRTETIYSRSIWQLDRITISR